MTMIYIFAALFIVLAIIFLIGKGDKLIAGYNTASEEERNEFNIHRLRLLMAIISVLTAGFCCILPIIGKEKENVVGATFAFIIVTFVFVILANTWAKKK
jgi:di/tricarboxylate transporter